ncbi:MAG: serine/threonine protein kinase [Candidatus Melainabacteria bacterium]|nr:serine/threonine protein kinase [Candidatus Melainabacteria bacterium]
MPLKDSFINKKQQKQKQLTNVIPLEGFPSEHQLKDVQALALANPQQTQIMTWQAEGGKGEYQLVVKHAHSADDNEVYWVLTLQSGQDSSEQWNYRTPDIELIDSILEATAKPSGPAAVIPDSLKPPPGGYPEEDEGEPKKKPVPEPRREVQERRDTPEQTGGLLKPGAVLSDRYEIVSEVGRGGMGVVYKARHLKMDRTVAIKVLHGHLLEDLSSKKRFEQEVMATASLSHSNCVMVYDCDFSPSGQPFLVMEYIEGVSLKEVLRQKGPLNVERFLSIFIQCCEGLAHAHSKGIVHRDMKPSNVMLVNDPDGGDLVKIVDFGVAKIMPRNDGTLMELTRTGDVVGSPHYMSPEQCMGAAMDWRTDIYSLGCVMYEAITGRVPLLGENPYQAMYMHIHEMPPLFSVVRPGVQHDQQIQDIVFKAMAKQLKDRYQGAIDVYHDLKNASINIDTSKHRKVSPTAPAPSVPMPPPMGYGMPQMPPYPMQGYGMPMPGYPMPGYPMQGMPGMPQQGMPGMPQQQMPQQGMQQQAMSHQGVPVVQPPSGDPVLELIQRAGLLKDAQIEEAKMMRTKVGGELVSMLVAQGAIKRCVKDAAVKCRGLIDKGTLKEEYATTLLKLCQSKDMKYEDAVEELGWRLG